MAGEETEGDMSEESGADDSETAGPALATRLRRHERPGPCAYKAFTTEFDEVVDAADLCDPDELARLRLMLDQQLQHLQGVIARLAKPASSAG